MNGITVKCESCRWLWDSDSGVHFRKVECSPLEHCAGSRNLTLPLYSNKFICTTTTIWGRIKISDYWSSSSVNLYWNSKQITNNKSRVHYSQPLCAVWLRWMVNEPYEFVIVKCRWSILPHSKQCTYSVKRMVLMRSDLAIDILPQYRVLLTEVSKTWNKWNSCDNQMAHQPSVYSEKNWNKWTFCKIFNRFFVHGPL